jgi:hypothetical protein
VSSAAIKSVPGANVVTTLSPMLASLPPAGAGLPPPAAEGAASSWAASSSEATVTGYARNGGQLVLSLVCTASRGNSAVGW